jgi:DNA-binding GntR family transcriptional regulator
MAGERARVVDAETPSRKSAYVRMKEAILALEHLPGEPLVETELARRYGISRTPVREALYRLEQDGLVQRGENGLIVRSRSPEEILDLYVVWIALEATAAEVACARRSDIDLVRIHSREKAFEASRDETPAVKATANRGLHHAIWRATHNESLQDLLERLDLHLGRYPETTLEHPGRWETSVAEHQQLIAAIEERDAETAAAIARRHLTAARDIRLEMWTAGEL